jgi:hypothetical protein
VDVEHDSLGQAERERRYREIRAATASFGAIPPGATETASFLLNETKASFDRAVADLTALEAKATVVLGIVAAAATALGLFGGRSGSALFATPLLAVAAILVIIALITILSVLRTKGLPSPNLVSFLSPAIVRRDHRIALALALAEYYATAQTTVRADGRKEARFLFIAYGALSAAAVVLLLNASVTTRPVNAPRAAGSSGHRPSIHGSQTGQSLARQRRPRLHEPCNEVP